jgi:hypothetical protein
MYIKMINDSNQLILNLQLKGDSFSEQTTLEKYLKQELDNITKDNIQDHWNDAKESLGNKLLKNKNDLSKYKNWAYLSTTINLFILTGLCIKKFIK